MVAKNSLFCGPLNVHCTSALTFKGKNAFENQNGVTVVQALQLEPVTTVDVISGTFLHPWELEFSELYQVPRRHQLHSHSVCWQMPAATLDLRVSL